jgi:predicted transcriptional regulator
MISVTHVISTISNEKALLIFKAVALTQSHDSKMLVAKLNLTHREFYSNMKKLIDTGLLKRTRCRYHLTSFGKIVFSAQAQVEIAIENYWKLKAFQL